MAVKSNKGRKVGRNSKWCQAYRASGKRELSKAKKLLKHLHKHGKDPMAENALSELPITAVSAAKKALKLDHPAT